MLLFSPVILIYNVRAPQERFASAPPRGRELFFFFTPFRDFTTTLVPLMSFAVASLFCVLNLFFTPRAPSRRRECPFRPNCVRCELTLQRAFSQCLSIESLPARRPLGRVHNYLEAPFISRPKREWRSRFVDIATDIPCSSENSKKKNNSRTVFASSRGWHAVATAGPRLPPGVGKCPRTERSVANPKWRTGLLQWTSPSQVGGASRRQQQQWPAAPGRRANHRPAGGGRALLSGRVTQSKNDALSKMVRICLFFFCGARGPFGAQVRDYFSLGVREAVDPGRAANDPKPEAHQRALRHS